MKSPDLTGARQHDLRNRTMEWDAERPANPGRSHHAARPALQHAGGIELVRDVEGAGFSLQHDLVPDRNRSAVRRSRHGADRPAGRCARPAYRRPRAVPVARPQPSGCGGDLRRVDAQEYAERESRPLTRRRTRDFASCQAETIPAKLSKAWIASSGSTHVAAARFSRRCATDEVPGISRMLGER